MKIMVAPDSFKGSLSAKKVADNIAKGIKNIFPEAEIIEIPMADGGEGTVHSLVEATDGKLYYEKVTGPLGDNVEAFYGVLGDGETAVIEMAAASGMTLVPEGKENPAIATTYGTGELIKAALNQGVKKIIVGIGGSATCDAGVGMAQALGVKIIDHKREQIGFGGGQLGKIKTSDISENDPRIKEVDIEVACDVNNPLYGKNGAAYVYAPQKGADKKMVKELDRNLRHFNNILKKDLKIDLQKIPGAGAAGGLGAGLVAFLKARIRPGVDIVLEVNKVEERMKQMDIVITGEGRMDDQTVNGKTPVGIARIAAKYDIPVVAICGSIGEGVEKVYQKNIETVFTIIQQPLSLKETYKKTEKWLQFTAEQVIRLIKLSDKLK